MGRLYALKMHGYEEHFGIDINPERMPPEVAIKNSIDALRAAADRVNHYDSSTRRSRWSLGAARCSCAAIRFTPRA